MKTIIHRAATRGHANHGWLDTHHTFSFADYYNPQRVHFGALRVLNDDRIDPGMGFGMHPHENMEIITIPIEGELEHKDSMGNGTVIRKGDVQVMSAGTGIYHSEFNPNSVNLVELLQIWILPKEKGVIPRYDQITLNIADHKNTLQQILSPEPYNQGVWIYQEAWFHIVNFDKDFSIDYSLKKKANGVYAFVISGGFTINNTVLQKRDGFGISDTDVLNIVSDIDNSELLLMEVPLL